MKKLNVEVEGMKEKKTHSLTTIVDGHKNRERRTLQRENL